MDFFERQERTKRTTRWLLLLFALAFVAVALATTLVVAALAGLFGDTAGMIAVSQGPAALLEQRAGLLAGVAAGSLALMLLASGYRAASLSRGGGQVARMLGGTPVALETVDRLERRFVNVAEEMAIASGLPVPDLYVLEQEDGINAFAAGLTQSDAAVAVTRGALERLNRAELQGVVAHEFSHIVNGDMRLNQRLIGYSFGILVLSLIGRFLLRGSYFRARSRSRGTSAIVLAGLALTVIGAIGVLLSRLIKASVSRQRESLADASAVQFTREPTGLAGALKKIGGFTSRLESVETEEVSHMLFGEGRRRLKGWLATHPPILERIRALDPAFEPGDYPEAGAPLPEAPLSDTPSREPSLASGLAAGASGPAGSAEAGGSAAADPSDALLERIGRSGDPALGGALLAALPEELRHAARARDSCLLVVLALALSREPGVAARQHQLLGAQLGEDRTRRCLRLRGELDELDPRLRLPLLELCMPALRQRPPEQLDYLFDLVERLLGMDGERRLFEYVLIRLLAAYLSERPDSRFERRASHRLGTGTALTELLTVAAAFGHADAAAARAAFRAGMDVLARDRRRKAAPEPDFDGLARLRDTARLDAALAELAALSPEAKRRVLAALLAVIRHDHKIEIEEIELFRAIAATLGCPLPPSGTGESLLAEHEISVNMAGT